MNIAAGARATLGHGLTRVVLALSAITVAATYPQALRAADALPGDLGDPLLNTFILGWDASRMPLGFSGLWSAPFFFPLRCTLALSEHLLGVAVFAAPVIWVTGNPVLAYNLAFLASYVLAGVGMYLLARSLWGRSDAAFVAALAFAFAPHRIAQAPHLQMLMSGWMPIALWGLHAYFATGSRRSLAVFAAASALVGLSNGYFVYFFAIASALVVVFELGRVAWIRSRSGRLGLPWRMIAELGSAALAVLAALAPAAVVYAGVRHAFGLKRSTGEMVAFSASASSYLRVPDGLWLWSRVLKGGAGEQALFPGAVIVALAVLALVTIRRSGDPGAGEGPARRAWHLATYAAMLGLAAWLAAGPSVPGPYGVLLRVLPGFDGLRVPARFIVVVALALSTLGSGGAAWLLSRMRSRAAWAVAAALSAAIVVEGHSGPMAMVPFQPDQPGRAQLNEWLARGPAGGAVELPIAGPSLEPFTLVYQYNTLFHRRPVVNGYSGYGYGLQDFLGGPGSPLRDPDALPGLLEGLRGIGVRYVVLHAAEYAGRQELGWPDPAPLVDAMSRAARSPGHRFGDSVGWLLEAPKPAMPVDESALSKLRVETLGLSASAMPDRLRYAFDGDIDTKWLSAAPQSGSEWIRLAFTGELDVGRVILLTSRNGVGDYPRGLVVESETIDGSRLVLFEGSFLPALLRGLSTGTAGAPAVLDLPSNRSRAIWLRQTGRTRTWQWAVHELDVFERRSAR